MYSLSGWLNPYSSSSSKSKLICVRMKFCDGNGNEKRTYKSNKGVYPCFLDCGWCHQKSRKVLCTKYYDVWVSSETSVRRIFLFKECYSVGRYTAAVLDGFVAAVNRLIFVTVYWGRCLSGFCPIWVANYPSNIRALFVNKIEMVGYFLFALVMDNA